MEEKDYLHKRGNIWWYMRRVPSELAELDGRGMVRKTTRKRSKVEAAVVAHKINKETEAYWETLLVDQAGTAVAVYETAIKRARALGIDYQPLEKLLKSEPDVLVERLLRLESENLVESTPAVEASLGAVDKPDMRLSEALDAYFEYTRDRQRGKAPDQLRKWKNPRIKAVRNLVELIGDKKLSEITRNDALAFREWWIERVEKDGKDPGSANKDIGAINQIINEVDDKLRLGLGKPFGEMRLRGEKHNPRVAFTPTFIAERLLAPNALGGLNNEACAVIHVMCNTGMRPSEIVNLAPNDIRLSGNIPHVCIRPGDRELKTDASQRDIPLLGIALEAMRSLPQGFTRYKGRADALSAATNKYLEENGLRQTPGHTLYSLRHTFQDRLTEIECPERIQVELMGHKFSRPKYGAGPSLKLKAEWLARVSY